MRTSILLILLIITVSVSAQIEKGTFSVGGGINTLYQKSDNKIMYFYINPQAGYFPLKNFEISLRSSSGLNYSVTPSERRNIRDLNDYRVSLGVGTRIAYYFNISDKTYVYPFFEFLYSYYLNYDEYYFEDGIDRSEYRSDSYEVGTGAGLLHFLNRNIALHTELAYNFEKLNSKTEYNSTTVFEGDNKINRLQLTLGFRMFFGR